MSINVCVAEHVTVLVAVPVDVEQVLHLVSPMQCQLIGGLLAVLGVAEGDCLLQAIFVPRTPTPLRWTTLP